MNWSHPLCCTVFLRVQYSAQFSLSYTGCWWHSVVQFISLLILFFATCKIVLVTWISGPSIISFNWTKTRLKHCSSQLFNQPYSSNIPDVPKIGQSPLLPIAQVSCLTMCSPWSNRLTEFARLHALRSGGSDQFCSFLPLGPQKLFVTSLELSWLVYCDSLLAGIPQKLINKIQRVINCAAPLVCKHVTSLLVELYWLPITEYKTATICYSVFTCSTPHLSDLLELYIPSCSLVCWWLFISYSKQTKEISRTVPLFYHWSLCCRCQVMHDHSVVGVVCHQ